MLKTESFCEHGSIKVVSKAELDEFAQTSRKTSKIISVLRQVGDNWKNFSEKTKEDMVLFAVTTITVAGMVLSACSPVEATQTIDTGSVSTEVPVTQTVEPTFLPEIEPTIVLTAEPLKVAEIIYGEGEELSGKQLEEYFRIEADFQKLWTYVTGAPDSDIKTEEWGELVAYVMADPDNEDSLAVGFERSKDPGVLLTFPLGEEYTNGVPDHYPEDGTALVAFTYLDLQGVATDGESFVLKWRNGQWVKMGADGEVIEKLSNEGVWEKEKKDVVLSMDPFNPTGLEWDKVFGDSPVVNLKAGDGFEFEGVGTWDKFDEVLGFEWEEEGVIRLIEDFNNNFVTIYPLPKPTIDENVHVDGFFQTKSPSGEDIFVIVQSMRNLSGDVVQIKMAISLDDPDVQRVFPNWFKEGSRIYFMPIAATLLLEEGGFCPAVASKDLCELSNSSGDTYVKEFTLTGNFPKEASEGFFIPEPMMPY